MYLVAKAAFMHNHRSYHPGSEIGEEVSSERKASLLKAGKAKYQAEIPPHPIEDDDPADAPLSPLVAAPDVLDGPAPIVEAPVVEETGAPAGPTSNRRRRGS